MSLTSCVLDKLLQSITHEFAPHHPARRVHTRHVLLRLASRAAMALRSLRRTVDALARLHIAASPQQVYGYEVC